MESRAKDDLLRECQRLLSTGNDEERMLAALAIRNHGLRQASPLLVEALLDPRVPTFARRQPKLSGTSHYAGPPTPFKRHCQTRMLSCAEQQP